jgi:hypothetical protein
MQAVVVQSSDALKQILLWQHEASYPEEVKQNDVPSLQMFYS